MTFMNEKDLKVSRMFRITENGRIYRISDILSEDQETLYRCNTVENGKILSYKFSEETITRSYRVGSLTEQKTFLDLYRSVENNLKEL